MSERGETKLPSENPADLDRTDPEGEREDRDRSKQRTAAERSQREFQVGQKISHLAIIRMKKSMVPGMEFKPWERWPLAGA